MNYSTDAHKVNRRSRAARAGERGFTLIEILVVVIIIGLLDDVIVPNVISRVEEARVTKAKSDIQALEAALTMFKRVNSKYPTSDQGLPALIVQPTDPPIRHWPPVGYLRLTS